MAGKFNLADHIRPVQEGPRDIETITSELLEAKRIGGEAILTIGQRLIEAKGLLSEGEWLPWLSEWVEFSPRTAQRFMRLAREWSDATALSHLGASKALALLALPEFEREEFIASAHIVDGEEKTVIDMTTRELETVIRERDEARLAAEQAAADKKAAEAAWDKISQEMAHANERIAGLNSELEDRTRAEKEAGDRCRQLAAELEELKSRPVDVAVEADPAAIEKARAEAVAEMEDRLSKAREAKEKEAERRKAAEDALAEADAKLEQAAKAAKASVISADSDLAVFKSIFEQTQDQVNRLHGMLVKVRDRDAETAGKMRRALEALADGIRKAAEI